MLGYLGEIRLSWDIFILKMQQNMGLLVEMRCSVDKVMGLIECLSDKIAC